MIDTLKLLVPIKDQALLDKIAGTFERIRKEDLKTSEIKFEFHSANIKLGSYNRSVNLKITTVPMGLFVECSLAKYAKGNNVEMIYPHDVPTIADRLYTELCAHVQETLPPIATWPIYRLDICYNWLLRDSDETMQAIDFINRIDYPRKKKYIYDTSVMHKGSAYVVKFYLKGPEFKVHDFKELEAQNFDGVYSLQKWAQKIVRFEVGLKHRYLPQFFGKEEAMISDIADDVAIQDILIHFLGKTFFYINTETMTSAEVQQKLLNAFSKAKATRLFSFYKNYYFDAELKDLFVHGGMNRSTLYRYKKDLKLAGIGFSLSNPVSGKGILEQLIIPSPSTRFDLPDYPATMPV